MGVIPEPFGFVWEHAVLLAGATLYPAIERYGCQCQDDMWAFERPLSYATKRMLAMCMAQRTNTRGEIRQPVFCNGVSWLVTCQSWLYISKPSICNLRWFHIVGHALL
jgi:hypothetical protein